MACCTVAEQRMAICSPICSGPLDTYRQVNVLGPFSECSVLLTQILVHLQQQQQEQTQKQQTLSILQLKPHRWLHMSRAGKDLHLSLLQMANELKFVVNFLNACSNIATECSCRQKLWQQLGLSRPQPGVQVAGLVRMLESRLHRAAGSC